MTRGSSPEAESVSSALERRVRTHVDRLAGLIGPRHLGRPSAFEATEAYVERCLGAFGDPVRRETYPIGSAAVSNFIVERRGTTRPEEIVIVGAHYDTVPSTPGADDNASAVAALIETVGLLRGVSTPRTLRFVAFACEEPPHFHNETMGSIIHARSCRTRGERIVGMVCLEMIGYYSDAPGSQALPEGIPRWLRWAFPRRGNFLASVGNLRSIRTVLAFRRGFRSASRLPLFSIALPELVHAIRLSDNSSFWDQGYPAIMVTDTSFCRNPHYHEPTDTPETLDYPRLTAATIGIAGGAARLAGHRGRLKFDR